MKDVALYVDIIFVGDSLGEPIRPTGWVDLEQADVVDAPEWFAQPALYECWSLLVRPLTLIDAVGRVKWVIPLGHISFQRSSTGTRDMTILTYRIAKLNYYDGGDVHLPRHCSFLTLVWLEKCMRAWWAMQGQALPSRVAVG